jgi:hypothetical protein
MKKKPGMTFANAVLVATSTNSMMRPGFAVPVFRLEPQSVPERAPEGECQTVRYGGRDLVVSGSMSEAVAARPTFTLKTESAE